MNGDKLIQERNIKILEQKRMEADKALRLMYWLLKRRGERA